jgi:DGQHR domain-containing protein
MSAPNKAVMRRRALRIEQDSDHPVYLFTLTGQELATIAEISRVSRNEGGDLIGYQRPEVKRHIQNITDYLDSEGPVIFPNSVIIALSSAVVFTQSRGPKVDDGLGVAGTLEIPLPEEGGVKPAWIVDGQQRTLALNASRRKNFPVPVSAFVADDLSLQRDQFLRINSAKPLPRGLINELLPEVSTILPAHLSARKAPSALCDMLQRDPGSPFCGLVRRPSSTEQERKTAVITDTVLARMLQDSFTSPSGVLFPFRNLATGMTDFAGVRALLVLYWNAVKETFPEAWGLPPEKSRLMHGVGIRAVGRLMDRVMSSIDPAGSSAKAQVLDELAKVQPYCRWTSGNWEELDGIRWNELQNIPSHVRSLSNYLVRAYLNARRATNEVLLSR